MRAQVDNKILFSGPPGAGKTTAIGALSDIPVVSTEARASDETAKLKERTTVAMDYGQIRLDDDEVVHLYGTPGQARFGFMLPILTRGAIGLVMLASARSETVFEELERFTTAFKGFMRTHEAVIGITRLDQGGDAGIDPFRRHVRSLGVNAPVMAMDTRAADDVRQAVTTLLTLVQHPKGR